MFVPLNNATRCDLFASNHIGGHGGRRLCVFWCWVGVEEAKFLVVVGSWLLFVIHWLLVDWTCGKVSC